MVVAVKTPHEVLTDVLFTRYRFSSNWTNFNLSENNILQDVILMSLSATDEFVFQVVQHKTRDYAYNYKLHCTPKCDNVNLSVFVRYGEYWKTVSWGSTLYVNKDMLCWDQPITLSCRAKYGRAFHSYGPIEGNYTFFGKIPLAITP